MDTVCYLVSGKFTNREFTVLVPVKKANVDEVEFFEILTKYVCEKLGERKEEGVIFYNVTNFTKLTRELQK